MTYLQADQFDQAEQYLLSAKRLDPAHFSPSRQIFLADIYVRKGNRQAAIQELQDVWLSVPTARSRTAIRHNLAQLSARPQ